MAIFEDQHGTDKQKSQTQNFKNEYFGVNGSSRIRKKGGCYKIKFIGY